MSTGRKNDQGKARWDLLPLEVVADVVDVLTYGAAEYAPDNWKKVANPLDRYFAAAMRHLAAWRTGEETDPESGRPHLAHAIACLVFLRWFGRNPDRIPSSESPGAVPLPDSDQAPRGAKAAGRGPLYPVPVRGPAEYKRVVIESPFAGDVEGNLAYARSAMRDAMARGEAPIASHLLYPQILDDSDPAERAAGINMGLAWALYATKAVFYVDRGWSPGMRAALQFYRQDRPWIRVVARRLGLPGEFEIEEDPK